MPGKRIDAIACSLLLVALFAPRETLAQRRGANEVGHSCLPIRVFDPDAPRTSPRRAREMPSFSASAILDLEFQIRLHRMARADRVEVKFFTPEGSLYQTLSAPVSPSSPADGERPRASHPVVSVTLPVAGTTIVSSALYGVWRVEVHLDGDQRPCARALELAIRP